MNFFQQQTFTSLRYIHNTNRYGIPLKAGRTFDKSRWSLHKSEKSQIMKKLNLIKEGHFISFQRINLLAVYLLALRPDPLI